MSTAPPRSGSRTATWITCLFATVAALALLRATNTSLEAAPLLAAAGLVLALAGLHLIYTRLRPDPFISAVTGGLAAVMWSGIVSGIIALAALRTGAPLIDSRLAYADAVLNITTPVMVAWTAQHFIAGWLLAVAYMSVVPLVFAAVVFLAWMRREAWMWELCFAFAGAGACCALLSALIPAVGAFAHYGVPAEVLALLPAGSGQYHLPIFESYRSGISDIIDIRHLEGVITFPSFHAAMALMTAYAVRDVRGLSGAAWVWSGLVMISAIPIGGHYAIDLLAGAAVWAGFALLARTRDAPDPLEISIGASLEIL